jgi:hypothetical protein
MDEKSRRPDLFIVDNSVSGWTGLRYLEESTRAAKRFDIATGHFEIGALLALDGKTQRLEKIRILMGAETNHRTPKAILAAVRNRAVEVLDRSIEVYKETSPFLDGVSAVLDAFRSGQIECRVYDRSKFHAKACITHAKLDVRWRRQQTNGRTADAASASPAAGMSGALRKRLRSRPDMRPRPR